MGTQGATRTTVAVAQNGSVLSVDRNAQPEKVKRLIRNNFLFI
jgi:hypothetical protein